MNDIYNDLIRLFKKENIFRHANEYLKGNIINYEDKSKE